MKILSALIEISLYASVIFGITVLAKRLLGNRLSPFLHYAVWSLFLLRLLLPVTLASPVQLITLPEMTTAAAPAQAGTSQTEPNVIGFFPKEGAASPEDSMPEEAHAESAEAPAPVSAPAAAAAKKPSLPTVLVAVWLIGAGIGIGYLAALYLLLLRRIRRNAARPAKHLMMLYREVKMELGVKARVPLVCQYGLSSPGLLFPAYVLMPVSALSTLDDEQIKDVLRHELVHFKRGDQVVSILLAVLNAVYWFHPLVWLAVRQIRLDMETACDARVVRDMPAERKGGYAFLILELFSRAQYRQVVLGMATGNTKSVAERRIKGVFMNPKSKRGAKLTCALLAAALAVGCFTTACVPVSKSAAKEPASLPEVLPVSAGDGASAIATPTPASAAISPLYASLGVPEHWAFDQVSTDGLLRVVGDLTVTLPAAGRVPVAEVIHRDVTEEDLRRVTDAFFGQEMTYTYAASDTKEAAEEYVEKWKELYESVIDGTCENKVPSFQKSVKEQYEAALARAKSAPSASEKKTLPLTFTEHVDVWGDPYYGFRGETEWNGRKYCVRTGNPPRNCYLYITEIDDEENTNSYFNTYRSAPEGVAITRDEAVALASALVEKIDDGLSLAHVMAAGTFPALQGEAGADAKWAWQCVFMREVHGVGTVYDSRDIGSDMDSNVMGRVNEAVNIMVDDRGVVSVQWINPMTVTGMINADAKLLPFETITAKLADQLRKKYDYDVTREQGEQTHTLYLQHAQLGLMRVGAPGSATYTLEPVWSFFIAFEETPTYSADYLLDAAVMGDPVYWNSLTVSALDGRLLDRDYGA